MTCRGIGFGVMRTADGERNKVHGARKVELERLHHRGVYVRRKMSECFERTGAKPIRSLWIDENRGDDVKEKYRSRLVVREKRHKGEDGRVLSATFLFSTMPRLDGIMTQGKPEGAGDAKQTRQTVANVTPGHFSRFLRNGYGTQDPSFQGDCTQVLGNANVSKGNSALFHNDSEDCRILVHEHEFSAVGDQVDEVFRRRYDLQITGRWSMSNDGSDSGGHVPQSCAAHRSFREPSEF